MTITELKKLRKKLTANPIENKEQLLWIRVKIKSLQTIESNKRNTPKPVKLTPEELWKKAYEEGKL